MGAVSAFMTGNYLCHTHCVFVLNIYIYVNVMFFLISESMCTLRLILNSHTNEGFGRNV